MRTKSHTGNKFSQISWAVVHVRDCSCAPILWFSMQHKMVPQQIAKFGTARFRQFRSTLRKDRVANYGSIY